MPRFCLFFLLSTLTLPGLAQRHGQSFVDSLTHEIARPKDPRDQIVLVYSIGKAYSSINLDSALAYSQTALRLAQQDKWIKSEGKANTLTGLIFFYKGDYPTARK